jgi:hypothetical protein
MSGAPEGSTPVNVGDLVASRLARRWVRIYTAMLSPYVRGGRRAEIESDLWEHLADARAARQSPSTTQLAVLGRMFTGIPSDLVWCGRARRRMRAARPLKERRLRIVAVICGAFALGNFLATNLLVDNPEKYADVWWFLAVPIGFFLVGSVSVVATVLLVSERRKSSVGATRSAER